MSTLITTKDIVGVFCPPRSARLGTVQNPSSGNSNTVKVVIPESEFKKTLVSQTKNIAQMSSQGIGKRNDIVRGVVIKQETYATLEVIEGGKASDEGLKFSDFLLQSASEASEEKYQLVETFGEAIGFFFGSRPKVYQYSGLLLNTEDYTWRDGWKTRYETEFRGTRCAETKKRAYLTYDFVLREGYLLGMSINQNSVNPNSVEFNFTMFVTREMNLKPEEVGLSIILARSGQVEAEARASEDLLLDKWNSVGLPPSKFSMYMRMTGPDVVNQLIKWKQEQNSAAISEAEKRAGVPTGGGTDAGNSVGSRDSKTSQGVSKWAG